MADKKYLEALIAAIKFVYEYSDGYFKTTEGRERSMVFRIAHHLANQIEGEGIFVDIEPTRCEDDVKRMSAIKTNETGNKIVPDLIIHKRKSTGYLVVEFKCYYDIYGRQNDFNKLVYLTKKGNRPHYKFGIFVYLTNKFENIEIHIFTDGCENTKLTDLYRRNFMEK